MTPPAPDLTIEGMPNWRSFAVYAWKRQEKYLYIGVTAKGYRRPFCSHGIIGEAEPVQDGDLFEFWFFLSMDKAVDFEAEMIQEYRPPYNTAIPYRRQTFVTPPKLPPRKCLGCQKFLPKTYSLWLCGNCERLKIIRTANRLVRLATEEWNKVEPDPEWRQSWDSMYGCQKRTCPACRKQFTQEVWWQAFCSEPCQESMRVVQVESTETLREIEWTTGRRY